MKRTNRMISILLAAVMVACMLPVSVFAADAATIENNGVIRYSETEAEVSFYPTSCDYALDWQYYYVVSQQNASMTADDVKNSSTAHDFDENIGVATFDVTNLASGVSYIHIVLVQKDNAQQVSNVLTLEIPEYVPLTITPSADGYELESDNTLTVEVGTTVTFTTSEIGCGMEYKEGSKVGPELVGSEGYSRTATFSEVGTYTIVASIDYKTAECTVVVVEELHQHKYFSSWSKDASGHWHDCDCGATTDYAEHTSSGAATEDKAEVCTICGYEISPKLPHTHTYNLKATNNDETHTLVCGCGLEMIEDCVNKDVHCNNLIEGCTVCGGYCTVQSIKHMGPFIDDTTGEMYVSMEQAGYIDGLRCDSCSEYVTVSPVAVPVFIGGVEYKVPISGGTAFIVSREDIADGSVSDVDMTVVPGGRSLVIAPGYIDSASAFKVTTGQGLGVTYSNDALKALLDSVGTGSNIKVATKLEKAEITRDEAKIIVAEWAEIVNTAEGEEQIKNLLTTYSIYELALLQQYTKILVLDDSTAQKLYELMMVEREKKKEGAGARDNEDPLAKFSVNTYAVAADGTQTYIPIQKSMQYTIPVDTSGIPENATLALYRINADGTRAKQEILSVANGVVIAQTSGNSDYVLVYTVNETEIPSTPPTGDNSHMWLWAALLLVSGLAIAAAAVCGRKRRTS